MEKERIKLIFIPKLCGNEFQRSDTPYVLHDGWSRVDGRVRRGYEEREGQKICVHVEIK